MSQKKGRTLLTPILEYIQLESSGSIFLFASTLAALIWANSPAASGYHHFWHQDATLAIGPNTLKMTVHSWVNDGLMALFFLLVGLEIKREFLIGCLSDRRSARLPIFAALGGMIPPALIFAAINAGQPTIRGWGIPMATDIAFALGVLSLIKGIPVTLKVLLASLAIIDDLGAVLIIALFYSSSLRLDALAWMGALIAVLVAFNYFGVRRLVPYVIVGIGLWLATFVSGVHATIAGVILAMLIPATVKVNVAEFKEQSQDLLDSIVSTEERLSLEQESSAGEFRRLLNGLISPLERLENLLGPWVSFLIVPLFALANAGVSFAEGMFAGLAQPAALGVMLGLLIGKPIGICLFSWLAIRLKLGALPQGLSFSHVAGIGFLGGIGFTMSLFIGGLAFGESPAMESVRSAILFASLGSSVLGAIWLSRITRQDLQSD